jgi:lysozyme family protein
MPITSPSILADLLNREGRFSDNPNDKGGRTDYGIAEHDHPEAWRDGKVTRQEAEAIYTTEYIAPFLSIPYPLLQALLVDYGVNSGPHVATKALQSVLQVEQDGELGPQTLTALAAQPERVVVNKVVGERVKLYGRIVQKNPSQSVFISGWLNRALEFLIP